MTCGFFIYVSVYLGVWSLISTCLMGVPGSKELLFLMTKAQHSTAQHSAAHVPPACGSTDAVVIDGIYICILQHPGLLLAPFTYYTTAFDQTS
jgi:hypothetical protein